MLVDNKKQTKRYEANLKLLFKLSELIQKYPELRFSQILNVHGFTRTIRPTALEVGTDWRNDFYLESEDLLERIERMK